MGTNFYIRQGILSGPTCDDDPEVHIGKRSAAGLYCWDCGVTLCVGGRSNIHHSDRWHKACPECGAKPSEERLTESSAGRELGFNKSKPEKKTGVRTCSSFNWAMQSDSLDKLSRRGKPIVDEYGRKFTVKQFRAVLEECPVRFVTSIGQRFS